MAVFSTMASKLTDMFASTSSACHQNGPGSDGRSSIVPLHEASVWYLQSMQSIVRFARDAIHSQEDSSDVVSSDDKATICSTALGLLLSIGLLTNSVDIMLEAAMLCDEKSVMLSDSSQRMLRPIAARTAEQLLVVPNGEVRHISCGSMNILACLKLIFM